jgi:hypothetical protein
MAKIVNRIYDNYSDAVQAVNTLEAAGVSHNDISLVANNVDDQVDLVDKDRAAKGAASGATAGAALGGGAGLLAGLGMLAIPGVGPVVAAGWLVATAAGAAVGATAGAVSGGIIGKLAEHDVDRKDAELYAEAIRRGGALVSVKADKDELAKVESILDETSFVDMGARRSFYQQNDWEKFDPNAPAYSREQIEAERMRYRQ